jgi:ribokinase
MAVRVVGSINVDVIMQVAALPGPGETVIARDTQRLPGGKGANQAVAAARMGARARLAAAVGDDPDGDWMLASLAGFGVDLGIVTRVAGVPTGTAHIAVDSRGENQIVVCRKCCRSAMGSRTG